MTRTSRFGTLRYGVVTSGSVLCILMLVLSPGFTLTTSHGVHLILDAAAVALCAATAAAFWHLSPLPFAALARQIAATFAIATAISFVHLLTAPQLNPSQDVDGLADLSRTSWQVGSLVAPLGLGVSLLLHRRGHAKLLPLLAGLALASLGLDALLDGMRPARGLDAGNILQLVLQGGSVLIWVLIAAACFRSAVPRVAIGPLGSMAIMSVLAEVSMVCASGPASIAALLSHTARLAGPVASLMCLASEVSARTARQAQQEERAQRLEALSIELEHDLRAARRAAASAPTTSAIVESCADAVISKTLDGTITSWNRGAELLFGYTAAQAIGKKAQMLFPPERATEEDELLGRISKGETVEHFETVRVTRGGRPVDVSVCLSPVRDANGVVIGASKIVRDITQRRRAEHAMSHLAAIVQSSDDAIISKTLGGIITSWNDGATRLFGYTSQEAVGQPMQLIFPPELLSQEDELIARISAGERIEHLDTVRVRKDGTRIHVSLTISPIRDARGVIVGASKTARDITERTKAETALRGQFARMNLLHQITSAIAERQDLASILQVAIRSLEDNLPVDFCCICMHDQPARTIRVAQVGVKSAATALELAMAEHAVVPIDQNGLSRCVSGELVYEPDIAQMPFPFPQRLAKGGLRSLVITPLKVERTVVGVLVAARREPASFVAGECDFLMQLCEHIALASNQAQLHSALQQAYDDLRQTQQAVMQQERLRALGQMASGIAHDINNGITPVSMCAEFLLAKEPKLSPNGRGYLEIIKRAIGDVAHTVNRMGDLYRQRPLHQQLAALDLNTLASQVIELTRSRWSDTPQQRGVVITMNRQLQTDLPPVLGVESEIREALINLIFNAVDAMPQGGTLTIRTHATQPSSRGQAPAITLEVIDTGTGMSEEARRRCFEPFFTTKGERGSGLGLAMVYGIAERHNASIEVHSKPGDGTTFRLTFPMPATPIPAGKPVVTAAAPTGSLHILVIDDDPLLTRLLRDALESDHHRVVTANGGQAGIDAFNHALEQSPFDVVITDLGMPYVDGRRVAAAIKLASPQTPVILLTGWGNRLQADAEIPAHIDRILNKPPKLSELREAIAQVTCTQNAHG